MITYLLWPLQYCDDTPYSIIASFKGHWQQKISTFYIEVFD